MVNEMVNEMANEMAIKKHIQELIEREAKIIRDALSRKASLQAEIDRLQKLLESDKERIETSKNVIANALVGAGDNKASTEFMDFRIQANPRKVEIEDINKVPQLFFNAQEPKLDKKRLKEAIEEGEVIEGVSLVQEKSLRIF